MVDDQKRISRHVLIAGRVQGVGFRAWVKRTADSLGVSGWVRNLRSGEVEAVFSGPEATVSAMITACRDGPEWSTVRDVSVENVPEIHAGPLTIVIDR